jgi:phosphomannomutase
MLIESLSGVRGFDTELTNLIVKSYGVAFCEFSNARKIIIGRDTRKSGERIRDILTETLIKCGVNVVDIGICPTPTVQFSVEHQNADGGVVITASHNPLPWNGLKFIGNDGLFLDAYQMKGLKDRRTQLSKNFQYSESVQDGKLSKYNSAIEDHINAILDIPFINLEKIRKQKFNVAVDAVNGAGYFALPHLLEKLNCQVHTINCSSDKPFPRNPEPLPENLAVLMDLVLEKSADIGFAVDPDGDRLAIVSNKGKPISEEYTLVLAEKVVLSKTSKKNKICVTNLSTTMAVDYVASQFGAKVIRTPIGEVNVAKKMREVNAVIGGEGNGGVILPEAHLGRDSLVGTVLVLQLLADENCSLSELMKSLPKYAILKKKIPMGKIDLYSNKDKLSEIASANKINTEDGIKFIWDNRWIHIRPSNTEPIIRIYAEAPIGEDIEKLTQPLIDFLEKVQGK